MLNIEVIKTLAPSTRNRHSYDEQIGGETISKVQYTFRDQPFDIFSLAKDIPVNCRCSWVYSYTRSLMTLKYVCASCTVLAHHGQ